MRYEVEEIDAMSLGKIAGILYGALGLVSWLFIPLFYAVLGFIMGLVSGAVYNLCARHFGGLRPTLRTPGAP